MDVRHYEMQRKLLFHSKIAEALFHLTLKIKKMVEQRYVSEELNSVMYSTKVSKS